MKIKLSELKHLVKKIIKENTLNELEKSTWEKISTDVKGKYPGLSSRVLSHSDKYGTESEKEKIVLVIDDMFELEIRPYGNTENNFYDGGTGNRYFNKRFKYNDKNQGIEGTGSIGVEQVQLSNSGESELNLTYRGKSAKVKDRRSAINFIKSLGNNLQDPNKINTRSFTAGY
jgi:hypothetical protein